MIGFFPPLGSSNRPFDQRRPPTLTALTWMWSIVGSRYRLKRKQGQPCPAIPTEGNSPNSFVAASALRAKWPANGKPLQLWCFSGRAGDVYWRYPQPRLLSHLPRRCAPLTNRSIYLIVTQVTDGIGDRDSDRKPGFGPEQTGLSLRRIRENSVANETWKC